MAIRISASATGAFGMTLSTALLAHIPAWANAWERLWQPHNIQWGTSQEQGLSAMFCLCTIFGSAVDWYLRRRFGECPDEKWDSYLADYTSNLPNRADRAGTFQPLTSFWDRVFSSSSKPSPSREIIFPPTGTPDLISSGTLDYSLPTLHKEQVVSLPTTPGFLRKSRSKAQKSFTAHNVGAKKRPGIKFKPMDELSSDSEEEGPRRPWLTQKPSTTSTDATLLDDARKAKPDIDVKDLDYDTELAKLQSLGRARDIQKGLIPEYSDNEDDGDLGLKGRSISPLAKQDQDNHTNSAGASSATSHTAVAPLSPTTSAHPHVISFSHSSTGGPGNIPLAPVPATPSLLKALDRVAEAQKQAYGNISPSPPIPHPLGTPPTLGAKNLDGLPTPHQPNAPAVTSPTPQTARSGGGRFWREDPSEEPNGPANASGQAKASEATDFTVAYIVKLREGAPRLEMIRDLGIETTGDFGAPGNSWFSGPLTDKQVAALVSSPHVEKVSVGDWGHIAVLEYT
ncbi:hypothetical protein ONZ45_g19413 [Pleurotus djamor]|nr:hypothetical protein ONZ45_g19413 [Pleurotus djamor]